LRILQATAFDDNNMDLLDRLQRYELVVIDDLGVERGTSYASEQVYSIIDTRYRSGKPLIVTTNLSPDDFKNADNLAHKRVCDRIIESSPIVVKLEGESRRKEIGKAKREKYQQILGFR
jgi:DNA replication protein DnaC